MNENAKKWVDALRSGEFTQTRAALKTATGYCCLGVACELYARETNGGFWTDSSVSAHGQNAFRFGIGSGTFGSVSNLPNEVMDWLGLRDSYGTYKGGELAKMNDEGATFAELADVIETQPEGLFQ